MRQLYSALFISDIHMPCHNKAMVGENGKIFSLIRDKGYNLIIQNGDLVCFDDFSSHEPIAGKAPDFTETLELVYAFNRQLRMSAPNADIIYVEGNHEIRLERYLVRRAPHLLPFVALKMPELLKLKDYNIKWKSYRERLFLHGLKVTHGTKCRPESGASARAELKAAHYNTGISGHCHRLGFIKDNDTAWLELGHLADPDYSKHGYLNDSDANWNAGFGEGVCCLDEATGKHYWFLKPIEIQNGHFVVDGKLY